MSKMLDSIQCQVTETVCIGANVLPSMKNGHILQCLDSFVTGHSTG